MKRSMTSIWLIIHLLAAPCCFFKVASIAETLTSEQIEELADRRVTLAVMKMLDLRKLAGELDYEWPVSPPTYSFAEHLERARKEATAMALEKYPETMILTAKLEAETKFSLLKIGDEVEIKSAKPPHAIYKGRVQAITDKAIRIGNVGFLYKQDIDADTLVRFSEEDCEKRKDQYVKQKTTQVLASRAGVVDEMMPVILEKELLADGYIPVKQSVKKSRMYFSQSNWLDRSAVLEERAQEWKKEKYGELIKPELENLYVSFGYQYDGMAGRWRLLNHIHDFPLSGSVELKRSFMEKIRGE